MAITWVQLLPFVKQLHVHVDRKATNTVPARSIPSPPYRNNIDEAP